MTKSGLQTLRQAMDVLTANKNFAAEEVIGEIITDYENGYHKLENPYWSQELADKIKRLANKKTRYEAWYNREPHGGYTLILSQTGVEEDLVAEDYMDEHEVRDDIAMLKEEGYNVIFEF